MAKKRPTKKKKSASGVSRKPSSRQLDKLDREILALANERAKLTAKRDNLDDSLQVSTDAKTLDRIVAQNSGPLDNKAVRAVFRELLSGSHAVARPTRETLYTVVSREDRFKAKALIDTFVYRSGDQIGAWS
ncbi:MAG: chorismate mutase, partial [Planctomycetes bacterium]|nr:chorismate mutase [Planctomycetota bacterium]